MILIIGGAFQGKQKVAKEIHSSESVVVVDGEVCSKEELLTADIINHFHLWIHRLLQNKDDISSFLQELVETNPNVVIIATELGCGVVPMEKKDRIFREETGRACCYLATRAQRVVRVICGIGMDLKVADWS